MSAHKYRAWHKATKKMHPVVALHFDEQQKLAMIGVRNAVEDRLYASAHLASEMELLQYTGLKDKHGVEIYEGDLIHRPDIGIAMLVRWNARSAAFDLALRDPEDFNAVKLWYTQATQTDYEVIGNVYEHPELFVEYK
jgi:hypothetical protein